MDNYEGRNDPNQNPQGQYQGQYQQPQGQYQQYDPNQPYNQVPPGQPYGQYPNQPYGYGWQPPVQQPLQPEKPKKTNLLALCIIAPLLFILVTLIMGVTLGSAIQTDIENNTPGAAVVFWMIFVLFIGGSIGYIISMIPPLVGLILTCVKRANGIRVGQLILFIIFTILPVVAWLAFLLISKTLVG